MEPEKIKSVIESLLFAIGEPAKFSRLSKIIGVSREEIERAVSSLREDYAKGGGMVIITRDDSVQMATSPENSEFVSQAVKSEIQDNLSRAALEVLSIVAYRGPISRMDIEAIRGVNCSFTLRSLSMRGLLERTERPGESRGYFYKISFDFMKKLGIDDLKKLPDYETLSRDGRIDSIIKN